MEPVESKLEVAAGREAGLFVFGWVAELLRLPIVVDEAADDIEFGALLVAERKLLDVRSGGADRRFGLEESCVAFPSTT